MTGPAARASVTIVEVAPRDGLQNDPGQLSTGQKIELVARAFRAGLRRIEVTSFVSPRAVPKLSDAEQVVAGLRELSLPGLSMIGLVVNERGVSRAAAAGVDEVNVVVVASEPFSQRNQGMSVGRALAQLPDLMGAARAAGLRTTVTIGTAFGCPFDGEIETGRIAEVAAAAGAAGPDEIALADTIGVAVPTDVTERFAAVRAAVPDGTGLRAHFHDTRRTGMANAAAAVVGRHRGPGRESRRHRRLPVRAAGHRQYRHRGSGVPAGPDAPAHRCLARGTDRRCRMARRQPGARGAGHAQPVRRVPARPAGRS